MILISRDAKPEESVYYTACCVLHILKERGNLSVNELYEHVATSYNKSLDYSALLLSVNFLFLIDKIETVKTKIKCI